MLPGFAALQLRSCDQEAWHYIQHASLTAPAYLLQSIRWSPWLCHPQNEIWLLQDEEILQMSKIKQGNIAPTWVLYLEFSERRSFTGVAFTALFLSIKWTFRGITRRWTEESQRLKPSLQSAAVSWSRVLTVRVTLARRRSYIAEPVIAMFSIADVSSIATFVGAPGLICILSVTIFWVFLSRDNIFCFRSSRIFFCRKRFFTATFNLLSNLSSSPLFFWVHRYLSPIAYYICISGRGQEGCRFHFLFRHCFYFFNARLVDYMMMMMMMMMMMIEMNFQQVER